MKRTASPFDILSSINCDHLTEAKGKHSHKYISWADAWQILKQNYPEAQSFVYENEQGFNYHHDNRTCWVKVGVSIEGIEHIEYLHVMDYSNKSIQYAKVTSKDITNTIQRAITKAIARHGLAINVYRGEDFPEEESTPPEKTYITMESEQTKDIIAYVNANHKKGKKHINDYLKSLDYEYAACIYKHLSTYQYTKSKAKQPKANK
tara:strand:+ start:1374 stop:1991 length:618 start_codon:yes stop_codon:yes gene_type:complete